MRLFYYNIFLLLISIAAFAQTNEQRLANVDIYLHTVDVGSSVYDNFGHAAIRVHDKNTGTDAVYNWGLFDASDPTTFAVNFYKGFMVYRLGVFTHQSVVASYKAEGRKTWEDKLNFTAAQKEILLTSLVRNTQPENISYQYHYFKDNCSTKIRDYIDEALGGALKEEYSKIMTGKKFRDAVAEGYQSNPEIQLSLDLLMNGNIDVEMNQWQQMFLPINLREDLLNFQQKAFITESQVLADFPERKNFSMSSFQLFGLIMVVLLAGIGWGLRKKHGFMLERCLYIPCFFIVLLLGIFGLAMPLNWILSEHIDLHHNANMFILWPIDLYLLVPLFCIIKNGRNLKIERERKSLWDKFIFAHIAFNLLFFLMWLVGVFNQDVSNTALYLMPCYTILLYLIRTSYSSSESVVSLGRSSIID